MGTFILRSPLIRHNAIEAVRAAPDDWVVTVKEPKRTTEQNAKFHAICSDISKSGIKWAGKVRTPVQWKILLVSAHAVATNENAEIVPGLEGEFINLRESTALMSIKRGSSLIEYALAWCAMNGVTLTDTRDGGWME